jgi:two-component system response regulator PilR (NtrC family)
MSIVSGRDAAAPRKNAPPNILIVDDEPDIIELLELTLARMGMDVVSARSLSEARQLLQSRRFQLCLTDMRLSDGEGLDLVKYIAQFCADLPVAVITAHGTAENAVAALKAGAFDYLAKPVSLKQLRDLVKSALSLPPMAAAVRASQLQRNRTGACYWANRNRCASFAPPSISFPAAKPRSISAANPAAARNWRRA